MTVQNLEDIYELSSIQQYMLFNSLYKPTSGVYVEQSVYTLRGQLDISAFARSWQHVAERHSVLRTAFFWEDLEKPLQVVSRHVQLPLDRHDWRKLSPVEQQARLEAYLQTDRDRGFTLSEAPLARLVLIQMSEDTYYFVRSFHHLLLDRWSVSLVLKEVFALYEAFCQGRDLQLPKSHPYRDYITWLQQQDFVQAEKFWRQALKGFNTPITLGVGHASVSPPVQAEAYDAQRFRLSVTATSALQSWARQNHLTLNTLVQGAWAVLLSRISGKEDVVFGATFSGRPAVLAEVESMVGLFMNSLPVRVQVSPDVSLLPWLQRLQNQMAELAQYEYSPLADVLGWSEVSRGQLLFDSILVFENIPVDVASLGRGGELEIRHVRSSGGRTNYPLTVIIVPGPELSLRITYDCYRFEAPAINRLLRHFQTLLEGIGRYPSQPLSQLLHLIDFGGTEGQLTGDSQHTLPLARNGNGDRRALPAVGLERAEPRNSVERRLVEIWQDVLGIESISVTDNFFELGVHSLLAVRLFVEIEKRLGRSLPLASIFKAPTIERLASILDPSTPSNGSSPLVAIQPQGSKPPFFCVHELFGDVLCYMNLARHLGEDQPFYALQARGLDGEEEPFADIEAMAAHYIEAIQTVQPQGPYALGGLCIGGIVAFEMAQQLRAKRKEVTMVALLDSSPGSRRNRKVAYRLSFLGDLLRDLPSWLIGSFELSRSQWLNLVKLKIRMGKARKGASRSSAVSTHQSYAVKLIEEMGDLFHFSEQHRKVARAQYWALKEYTPRMYPGRLTLFRARMQPFFSSHAPDKGWRRLAAGGFDIRVVPGNHLGMLQEPHVKALAKELRACLDKANRS